ncbi:MAG: NAD(P)/FAD-dependent oxidoreductase [Brumimicrobium sp.]|nr:NAD(P)/FAD-dependent oxidoreductase [Brumimicrobium sp.]
METNKIRIPESNYKKVVVIGGGFAGLNLAKKLKNKPIQVIFLDRNNFHQFQPLLYQVATSGIVPDSITFPFRKEFNHFKNIFFRMANVLNIDTQIQTVFSDIGSIEYDYLVIATGSDTNFFGMENVERNSFGMKSIQEALDIRSLILEHLERAVVTTDLIERKALMNFTIIGGGPAGVETAGALAEFKRFILPKDYPDLDASNMSIHIVEASDKLLGTMSKTASEKSQKYLEELGVNIYLNTAVTSYDGFNIETNGVVGLKSKSVIWTAGVKGSSPEGLTSEQYTRGNRILVNEFSQIKNLENVFAIGDVACMITESTPKGHPMLAQVAIQQGRLLGENLLRKINGKEMQPFTYKDKGSMATVGKRRAVADLGRFKFGGYFAWLLWSGVHLISISGFKNKLLVGISWVWSYFTFDKGNRLIIRRYQKKKVEELID